MGKPPVPYAKVAELAANVRDLMALRDQQQATQAQLIRWCLWALRQPESIRQWGIREELAAKKKVRENKLRALRQLAWLADKLEGKDVPDLATLIMSHDPAQPSTKG